MSDNLDSDVLPADIASDTTPFDPTAPQSFLNADQRAGAVANDKPSFTVDQAAAQLDRAGLSWSSALGQPATVTYAFRADAPATLPNGAGGFQQFSATQITAAELSLHAWSDVANITFQRVGSGVSGAGAYSDEATILFSDYSTGVPNGAAFTYLPGNRAASSLTGDVFVNNTIDYNMFPISGAYGQQVLTHEIGHAIGLSHPSDYDAGDMGGNDLNYATNASYYEDSRQYSIMSYFASASTGASASIFAAAPQLDDIAAAQRMYGANYNTRAGDTTYGFNNNSGEPWYSFDAGGHIYAAIWDGGGTDTLNFSVTNATQLIDLREGDFSNVGGDIGNVAIAVGARIENAIGGNGADTLIGNGLNNLLQGGLGSDTFVASAGSDTLSGGGGADTVQFAGLAHSYAVSLGGGGDAAVSGGPEGGTDTLISVETLAFAEGALTTDTSSFAAQVARLYEALGRTADPQGLDSFEQVLIRGGPLTSVAQAIVSSGEFAAKLGPDTSNTHFVTYLYEALLHREPDPSGLSAFVGQFNAGASRASVLVGLSESGEHVSDAAALAAAGLWQADDRVGAVVALYDAGFARLPDPSGAAAFFAQLAAGVSVHTVAAELASSAEFASHFAPTLSNQQYVDALYQQVLHRAADPGGEAAFTGQLNGGASRADVYLELAASQEHQSAIFVHTDYGLLAG